MFQSIKRARYIAKYAAHFSGYCGHDIAKVHIELQRAGCPANELVDLYMRAQCSHDEFCAFFIKLHEWWMQDDYAALEVLCEWTESPNVEAADTSGLTALIRRHKVEWQRAEADFQSNRRAKPDADSQASTAGLTEDLEKAVTFNESGGYLHCAPSLVNETDQDTFGADLVKLCQVMARNAVLLGYGVTPRPVTADDEEVFGGELLDLMRRAIREEYGRQSVGERATTAAVRKRDVETFGMDMIDCLWRVAFDELHHLHGGEK